MFLRNLLKLLALTILASCAGENLKDKGYDTKAIAQEVEDRKIKHVTEAQLLDWVEKEGEKSVKIVQDDWLEQLKTGFKNNLSIVEVAKYCIPKNLYKVDSISKKHTVDVKKVSFWTSVNFSDKEKQILEAYIYNVENKLPLHQNLQKIDEKKQILFTSPIILADESCLKCHGTIDKDLSQKDWNALVAAYPNIQNLKNQTLGKPIGMWSMLFSKKEVIRGMNVKKIYKK